MSLKLDEITEALTQAGLDINARKKAIAIMEQMEKEKKEDRADNAVPKSKKQFVICLRGNGVDLKDKISAGYIVQVSDTYDIQGRLINDMVDASKEHNQNTKKKANFINTWLNLFAKVKRGCVKNKGIAVKTKEAVQVVFLENEEVKV